MKAVKSIPAPRLAASAATPIAPPQPGQIVGERYRLEEWLESGAMGSVWRAEQIRLRSPAAIKFLEPSLIEVPEMLERFLQEARSAAAVHSAHVIQVFDYGSVGRLPFIAMEFLEGENLEARLARLGLLAPAELDKIFSELARGLGQAHELGVIHRDVKPGNIFLAREGKHEVTKLIDFGIAKVKADALRVSQVVGTELGTLLGTPQYMSPEQMRGRSTVDYRTDLWSLAIIACECLTGRYPFAGATIADLTVQICTEPPLAPSTLGEVPDGFDQWFFKGASKEPSDRFESAADMAEALTRILLPRDRAAESVRKSLRLVLPTAQALHRAASALVLPTARALRRAASAGARLVLQYLVGAFERARALSSISLTRALRQPGVRRLWSRPAGVGLALLILSGGLVLGRPERRSSSPSVAADVTAQAISADRAARAAQVLLPSTPLLAVPATSAVPRPEPVTRAALPVLTPDELPLVPPAESAGAAEASRLRSTPAKTPEARRRTNRQRPPVASDHGAPTPSSPMSSAMVRLGALLAQGGEKKRPARAPAATPVRAPERRRAPAP